ncbi:hypothetical protein C1645_830715 [Glomus cerebriforme]|uniref:Uncharacterized protein n=1 Tax=Glomus cerebriforme TaxID=658196 RepID=A0A397SS32_9GLOM|nr:hypothetical protein C1645_830715 [Glomus cerebriforme]
MLNILQRVVLEQYRDHNDINVALKSLNNSKDITLEFFNEINLNLKMNHSFCIVNKDPKTGNFTMVMQYALIGNLRQTLNGDLNSFSMSNL